MARQYRETFLTRGLPLAALLLTLSGCTGVLESNRPAREIYLLQPPPLTPVAAPADAPRLVLTLVTVPGLDTDDIQVLAPNARLIPVANAHWPDYLPEVISSLSRRTLISSGQFRSVSLNDLARPDDWRLQLELQAFYGIQNSSGATTSVRLEMEGTLSCGEAGDVIRLDSNSSVSSASLADLVAAHQRVLNEALTALPARIRQVCEGA